MKILITSIVDLKKSQHNRLYEFIKYLSEKHEITVLSINDWWKGRQDNLEYYIKDFDDVFKRINYRYLTEKKVNPIFQELYFKENIKEILKENFDIHLNYSSLITGYMISKNIETVFDMADDLIAMIKDSPQIPYVLRPLGGYLGKEFLKKNIEKSKKIMLSTDLLKETYNIPEEKVEIIPNGVDTNLFKNYEEAKKELGLNGFIIGYVGVLREWVDLEPVFKALKILTNKYRDIKMVVVGKEGRFKENIELAEKYEVGGKVIFTGTIPYSQVPKYISVMDVCLIPFKLNKIAQNALPLKLFEYMACEKPVISTEIQGVKRAVGNKVLYASDVREYTEKINMLYEDKRLRGKLGKEGRRFVEENYRGEEIAKRVEDILMRMN